MFYLSFLSFSPVLSLKSLLSLQPLSPSSQRRLKQLTDKHGSGKIYQVTGAVVGSRDLDLSLAKGELVAIVSEADSRGDKRRWLVDAGGTGHTQGGFRRWFMFSASVLTEQSHTSCISGVWEKL